MLIFFGSLILVLDISGLEDLIFIALKLMFSYSIQLVTLFMISSQLEG